MDHLLKDLRFGLKLLWKEKAFTAAAVLTLGLAIGANTAIFSIIDSVLLEPLPFEEPERLVTVFNSYPNAGAAIASNGVPDYFDRRKAVAAFEESALYNTRNRTLGEAGTPERVRGMNVTPSLFKVLRTEAHHGRTFTEEEGIPGNDKVVILSRQLHQNLYGGDVSAVGRDLRIDGEPRRIVGVMAEDFLFRSPEILLWVPLAFTEEDKSDERRHSNSFDMIARLAPGAGLDQAQQQIDAINTANLDLFPNFRQLLIDAGFHTQVHPYLEHITRDVRSTLYLLWGGVGFVLLIACVNLANLFLVRANGRMKELATRLAIGAGRRTVARQLLTESVLLCTLGGLAGLGIGAASLWGVRRLGIDEMPRGTEIALDGTVVLVTLGLAFVLGIVLGVIPILRTSRLDLNGVLREESRGGTGSRGTRLAGRALVTAQVAFAFVLLIGAGLLLASFRHVLAADPGYATDVLTASLMLPEVRYPEDEDIQGFYDRAIERVRALPGVSAAGLTDTLPLDGSFSDSVIFPEGYAPRPGESVVSPTRIAIGPGYLEAMDMPILKGRAFDSRDTAESADVILVDQLMAEHFWGDQDPLGRRMFFPGDMANPTDPGPNPEWLTVIGVVPTVKLQDLEDGSNDFGAYYLPLAQNSRRALSFALRTDAEPASLLPTLRAALTDLDPELPVFNALTMADRVDDSLLARRSPMLVALAFAGVALFLAAIGIYGVLAYLVAQRSREMGIRMALGSSAGGIFRLVMGEGLWIVGLGLCMGMAGAFALREILAGQLYGVQPMDPGVLLQVVIVLGLVSLVACAVPGWRAVRIDPATALHE